MDIGGYSGSLVDISRSFRYLIDANGYLILVEFSGIIRLIEFSGFLRYKININRNLRLIDFSRFLKC